jgi:signal-transduction protein with cAMP-binding, CBS, and nucleotidyltransferase domain
MTLTQRIFVLSRVPGFDQLRDEELPAVAASMTERTYRPGEVVVSAGSPMSHLLVVVAGHVRAEGSTRVASPVIGADLLILNRPAGVSLTADDDEGAVCLRMSKGHFYTIVNECPALLVEMGRLRRIDWIGQRDRG